MTSMNHMNHVLRCFLYYRESTAEIRCWYVGILNRPLPRFDIRFLPGSGQPKECQKDILWKMLRCVRRDNIAQNRQLDYLTDARTISKSSVGYSLWQNRVKWPGRQMVQIWIHPQTRCKINFPNWAQNISGFVLVKNCLIMLLKTK